MLIDVTVSPFRLLKVWCNV